MAPALAVFTRGLRLRDNPALHAAAPASSQVIPCFVVDDEILALYRGHANRLAFLADALADLDGRLSRLGGALVVRRGPWAETVVELARTAGSGQIHVADDYSAFARRRLAALDRAAGAHRLPVTRHPG